MKKIISVIIALCSLSPAIASAKSPHYYFRNVAPQYTSILAASNSNQAPFGLGCALAGSKDQTVTWTVSDMVALRNDGLARALPSHEIALEALRTAPVVSFVAGTDIESTEVAGNSIAITYTTPGEKSLWYSETDGVDTEVEYCGSITIQPVHVSLVKVLSNGVSLTF